MKQSLSKILSISAIAICFNVNALATHPVWHGMLGGSYIYENHFNKYLQGFEINLNKHYSNCVSSIFLSSYGLNVLFSDEYKEYGISYTGRVFRTDYGPRHGGFNFIYKINPNFVNGTGMNAIQLKPGIGVTAYTGARMHLFTLQWFALLNYDLFIQKNQNVTGMKNVSVQIGIFIGFTVFDLRPKPMHNDWGPVDGEEKSD